MTVLILHGIGGYAGIHWQQWLHDELIKLGHKVIMPNLPDAERPDRDVWFAMVKKLLNEVELGDLIIVGHSLGVVTALDFLESISTPIKSLISVAGFYEDYGLELNSYFMNKKSLDIKFARTKVGSSYVIYGDDDPYVPQDTLSNLTEALEAEEYIVEGGGHLNIERGFIELPLVLDSIKNLENSNT